jgi:uncharacterized protein involved in exopolysaccharide biosynthesis
MTALSRPIGDPRPGSIDLRDFLEAVVRRKRLVVIVVVAVTALAALYSYADVVVRPRRWSSSARH